MTSRESFTAFVASTQHQLRRMLAAMCCGDTAMADDVAQEAYMRAWSSRHTLDDESKARGWLMRIACNCFISACRSRRPTVDLDDARELAGGHGDAPFRYQDLYSALAALTPVERTAVSLHYLEGYSIKEISALTGCSDAAVKQQLSRGRKHLRMRLER